MNINEVRYTNEQIEELANILNSLPFSGFNNAMKVAKVFSILNSPIQQEEPQKGENK